MRALAVVMSLCLWSFPLVAQAADAEIVHEGFRIYNTEEVSGDEPYLIRLMYRIRLGQPVKIWVDPTSGPGTQAGTNVAQIGPAVFPDLQPFELYGVWMVAMERDNSDARVPGAFATAMATDLRGRLNNRLQGIRPPADAEQHVETLLREVNDLFGTYDGRASIFLLTETYFADTFRDDDDFSGDSWVFSLHAPAVPAERIEHLAFERAGVSREGHGSGQKGFAESTTDWFLPEHWDRTVTVDMMDPLGGDYAMSVTRRAPRSNAQPEPAPEPPAPTDGCAPVRNPVYVMPGHQRVAAGMQRCDGVDHVPLQPLADALGLTVTRDGNAVLVGPAGSEAEAGPVPVPAGAGELIALGPWAVQQSDVWSFQPVAVRRHGLPYAFDRRHGMDPIAPGPYPVVYSVEGTLTNLDRDGRYARFTDANDALGGDDRYGPLPLTEADALGPAWEVGRVEIQPGGSARPVRLLFLGPADYKPSELRVRLPNADLTDVDLRWSFADAPVAPAQPRLPLGQRPPRVVIAPGQQAPTIRPDITVPEEAPPDLTPPPKPGRKPPKR